MKIVPHYYDPFPVAGEQVAVELMTTYFLDLRCPICLANQTFALQSWSEVLRKLFHRWR